MPLAERWSLNAGGRHSGRPGERIGARNARSAVHCRLAPVGASASCLPPRPIEHLHHHEVLRRPVESALAPGIGVGPSEGDRETAMERTPAEPGHLEGPEDRHLRGDLPADDPAPRGVDEHRRRPSLRWCGRRSGPRPRARSDVPTERPGERGRGRRRCVIQRSRTPDPADPGQSFRLIPDGWGGGAGCSVVKWRF